LDCYGLDAFGASLDVVAAPHACGACEGAVAGLDGGNDEGRGFLCHGAVVNGGRCGHGHCGCR